MKPNFIELHLARIDNRRAGLSAAYALAKASVSALLAEARLIASVHGFIKCRLSPFLSSKIRALKDRIKYLSNRCASLVDQIDAVSAKRAMPFI